jgi:NADH:ubiquinone oxidoreductase subunit K
MRASYAAFPRSIRPSQALISNSVRAQGGGADRVGDRMSGQVFAGFLVVVAAIAVGFAVAWFRGRNLVRRAREAAEEEIRRSRE